VLYTTKLSLIILPNIALIILQYISAIRGRPAAFDGSTSMDIILWEIHIIISIFMINILLPCMGL
jgi:hypothetical protein